MSKIAVIYWSQTGNTEAMANAVAEGIREGGAEAEVFTVDAISASDAAAYSKLALGCPAMGAEVLEESEFEPFFCDLEGKLGGHKVGLFGSYGWGDGQWMRDWVQRTDDAGAILLDDGLTINETPDEDGLSQCRDFGKRLASC